MRVARAELHLARRCIPISAISLLAVKMDVGIVMMAGVCNGPGREATATSAQGHEGPRGTVECMYAASRVA